MARANTSPPAEAALIIFGPRDTELAQFVEDALAFKPVTIRAVKTIAEVVAALREVPVHGLVVDIDAMSASDARQLAAALAEVPWLGSIVGVGTASSEHREALRLDHLLSSRVTSVELRAMVAWLVNDHARAPKIAVPMRT